MKGRMKGNRGKQENNAGWNEEDSVIKFLVPRILCGIDYCSIHICIYIYFASLEIEKRF